LSVARDVFIKLDRCHYCNRPGFIAWDIDLFTCGREVCKSLAFAEVRHRHHDVRQVPEKRLARALLTAFDTFDYALRLDEESEVVNVREGDALRNRERERTAHLLSELRELSRKYPPPADGGEPSEPEPPPSPRYRRFVSRGRTVPLRRRGEPATTPAAAARRETALAGSASRP
jgi:hypothetical protein